MRGRARGGGGGDNVTKNPSYYTSKYIATHFQFGILLGRQRGITMLHTTPYTNSIFVDPRGKEN